MDDYYSHGRAADTSEEALRLLFKDRASAFIELLKRAGMGHSWAPGKEDIAITPQRRMFGMMPPSESQNSLAAAIQSALAAAMSRQSFGLQGVPEDYLPQGEPNPRHYQEPDDPASMGEVGRFDQWITNMKSLAQKPTRAL